MTKTYSRPKEGFRFVNGGMKTNCLADAVPINKYVMLFNVRAVKAGTLEARAGLQQVFHTGSSPDFFPVTDIRAYSTLGTDNRPRVLARDLFDQVWLDTGTKVGQLNAAAVASPGASLIPFRPAQSPDSYMYIANGTDYQKFSAPDPISDAVTMRNVGIAEPSAPLEACPTTLWYLKNSPAAASWTNAGTAGAITDATRSTDTIGVVRVDPAGQSGFDRVSLQVGTGVVYSAGELVSVALGGGVFQESVVLDVPPPIPTGVLGISSIYYYDTLGHIGRCIVVPTQSPIGGAPTGSTASTLESQFTMPWLASLRRGSLIQFSGSSEICLVLSVSKSPDNTISIETSTTITHVAGERISGIPCIVVSLPATVATKTATSAAVSAAVSTGVGTLTFNQAGGFPFASPFGPNSQTAQDDDYLHVSLNISRLDRLLEAKILIDVGDGTFTGNFYYYSVRANDITAGIANTLTQLGAAQLVSQRAIIDKERALEADNQGHTQSSAQTTPGNGEWSELWIPIRRLTRVGNDQTKTLANMVKFQLLVNCSGNLTAQIGSIWVGGGFQADTGQAGAPYLYCARPRSRVTGAKGNPSSMPRYGITARRQQINVQLPSPAYDPQIDTWDVFRYGGTVASWRLVASVPSTQAVFADIYGDDSVAAGEELEFDNLEPWPTIRQPLSTQVATIIGTAAQVFFPSTVGTDVIRLLPGNLVQIGNRAYTLRQRPIPTTSFPLFGYIFELIENAGTQINPQVSIYEPLMAKQGQAYMWGPDAAGTVFGVGDPFRPGTVSFAKNNNPDSAPDKYNIEITGPSEPLLGGEILEGLSFIASTERWFAMYPNPQNQAQRYSIVQQPVSRGLAAPFGKCNDGTAFYWWAKDGIYASNKGSMTDDDLYNIFPHEGVPGSDVTYKGKTVQAPDYSRAGTFRLAVANGYLYATYQDSAGTYRSLTCEIKHMAWMADTYAVDPVSTVYRVEQQEGTVLSNTARYNLLLMGTLGGRVATPVAKSNDFGVPVSCAVFTPEWPDGDVRGDSQWGDLMLDCLPAATVLATPLAFGGTPAAPPTVVPPGPRAQRIISLQGGVLTTSMGLAIEWSDDFTTQLLGTELNIWQPSTIDKPEIISDRDTDWDAPGDGKAMYIQGFLLKADTYNLPKGLAVRSGDDLTVHGFKPTVQHNGESIQAYSFDVPFIAHTLRIEPTDQLPWRMFDVEWVAEPAPESAQTWQTQGTAFGMEGFSHIPRMIVAYAALSPVTLTITVQDGTSPVPIVLPSTGGAYRKIEVVLSANKGRLYFFSGTSNQPWRPYLKDWEVPVGNWGRTGEYVEYPSIGGPHGDQARV